MNVHKKLAKIAEEVDLKVRRSKADNLDIGYLLREAKELIAKGTMNFDFYSWCRDHVGMGNRQTPNEYLRLAELSDRHGRQIILQAKIHTTSLFKLARPSTPAAAVKKVLAKAKKEHLTATEVSEIIETEKLLQEVEKQANSNTPDVSQPDAQKEETPPFRTSTNLWDTSDPAFRARNNALKKLMGDDGKTGPRAGTMRKKSDAYSGTHSVFPPALVEDILQRYAPKGAKIVDPFAGGPPRGFMSAKLGYEYFGWDVNKDQIDFNKRVLKAHKLKASYFKGDGITLEGCPDDLQFDFCLSCPPYWNLEKYKSGDPRDLSHADTYQSFNEQMKKLPLTLWKVLKPEAFVCLVVGNFRKDAANKMDKELVPFVEHTIANFQAEAFQLHQQIILKKPDGSAAVRAANSWKGMKLVPTTETLLVFRRPDIEKKPYIHVRKIKPARHTAYKIALPPREGKKRNTTKR